MLSNDFCRRLRPRPRKDLGDVHTHRLVADLGATPPHRAQAIPHRQNDPNGAGAQPGRSYTCHPPAPPHRDQGAPPRPNEEHVPTGIGDAAMRTRSSLPPISPHANHQGADIALLRTPSTTPKADADSKASHQNTPKPTSTNTTELANQTSKELRHNSWVLQQA